MKKSNILRKAAVLCAVLLAILTVTAFYGCVPEDESASDISVEPMVSHTFSGIKDAVEVYADDSAQTINFSLLRGVTSTCPYGHKILVAILSPADESEITEITEGEYIIEYSCDHGDAVTARSFLKVNGADTVPPVIAGASDKLVYVGGTVSYREGVTVTDNTDQNVQLKIDASGVNLTAPGVYPVIYSATDCRGNTATVTVSVNVVESDTTQTLPEDLCTREEFDALCRNILNSIVTDKMTEREKAEAIFNRVNSIKYVYTEDCLNWMSDAYIGLTTGRGDCVNYAAASKALLTLAGIPNYDLQRYGGDSEHFWQIVYVDGGWYHFDACPTSRDYPLRCFLLTEEEVAEYTAIRTDKPNYYVYDNDACPYEVVKSRNEE